MSILSRQPTQAIAAPPILYQSQPYPPGRVLVLVRDGNFLEFRGPKKLDVCCINVPSCQPHNEIAIEQLVERLTPDRFRFFTHPSAIQHTHICQTTTVADIAKRQWELDVLDSLKRLEDSYTKPQEVRRCVV